MTSSTIAFTKGHGTENDFVLVLDRAGDSPLTPPLVRALTDRRSGIGGDGVIRVVPARHADEPMVREQADGAEWFMDYWNADGSTAEMCGNGTRVFAAFLDRAGLLDGAGGADGAGDASITIATRAGAKTIRRWTGGGVSGFAVNLGPWEFAHPEITRAKGFDALVTLPGTPSLPGVRIDTGNPHTVVVLPRESPLASVDLSRPPQVEVAESVSSEAMADVTGATNVELVEILGPGRLRVRVHERGVGETRSCGTGAVAAVLAVRFWEGSDQSDPQRDWVVEVPGGVLGVRVLADGTAELAGPAVLVAEGTATLELA